MANRDVLKADNEVGGNSNDLGGEAPGEIELLGDAAGDLGSVIFGDL